MSVSNREIVVLADPAAVAEAAAARLSRRIAGPSDVFAVALSGGSTPRRLYELLAKAPWREQIPWSRVHWFVGDERMVPIDDPLSNMGMARRDFLNALAPSENVHPVSTNAPSPDAAARLYEDELRSFHARWRPRGPLFDLVLMGVGEDGHTASLFPSSAPRTDEERWVIGAPTAGLSPFVPRVSLTLPCLGSTREMLFCATGADKKAILKRVFAGEPLPASLARSIEGETVWLLDAAASPDQTA